jgi:putrescine transport system permease protein
MSARAPLSALRRFVLGAPALWLLLFFLAPFALVLKIALSKPAIILPSSVIVGEP